jgi:hypothetical protein
MGILIQHGHVVGMLLCCIVLPHCVAVSHCCITLPSHCCVSCFSLGSRHFVGYHHALDGPQSRIKCISKKIPKQHKKSSFHCSFCTVVSVRKSAHLVTTHPQRWVCGRVLAFLGRCLLWLWRCEGRWGLNAGNCRYLKSAQVLVLPA